MFGFGQRRTEEFDGVMRLAFCLDDFSGQAGVAVRQRTDGLDCTAEGPGAVELVRR